MKEVAVRSQHLSSLEAIRFGETMRIVAAQKQQEANAAGSPLGVAAARGQRRRRVEAVEQLAEAGDQR